MSQTQPPPGMGNCAVCKQAQRYTNQVCDICHARLPWAVAPPTTPVPTTAPVRPQFAPQAKPHNSTKTVGIVLGAIFGGVMLIGVATVILLSILGNRLKPQFEAAASAGTAPSALTTQRRQRVSAECGLMTAQECDWARGFDTALSLMNFDDVPGESFQQSCDRLSRETFLAKAKLRELPPTPPRCTEALALTIRGMDELDTASQLVKKAVDENSTALENQAADEFDKAGVTFNEVHSRMKTIRTTPP